MNKRFFLIPVMILLLMSFTLGVGVAPLNTTSLTYLTFDNTLLDSTPNSNDATNTGGASYTASGKINGCYDYDGASDYMILDSSADYNFNNAGFTINLWINSTDDTTEQDVLYFRDSDQTNNPLILIRITTSGGSDLVSLRGTLGTVSLSGDYLTNNEWTMLTLTLDRSGANDVLSVYKNGGFVASNSIADLGTFDFSNLPSTTGEVAVIGGTATFITNFFKGGIDEFTIANTVYDVNNMLFLYGGGTPTTAEQWPFPTPAVTGTHVLETDVQLLQLSPVKINSNTFQLINSNTFLTLNESNASFSATLDVESSKVMDIECKFLINGTDYGTLSERSFSSASKGNMYITSEKFAVSSAESVSVDLYCRRTSVNGKLTVSNYVGIVHLLSDFGDGREINHKFINSSFNLINDSYHLLSNTTFLTSNLSANGLMRNLVFDGSITYNYANTSNIKLYSVVNGVESPVFVRYGLTGTKGNGGNFNIAYNLTNETNIPLLIYGKSSSLDGSVQVKLTIKEFIGHSDEFNKTNLNGSSLASTTWATLKKITLVNDDHATGDIIAKASVSTISTSGTQEVDYRLYYNGTEYSPEIMRSINNDGAGVSILQYLFKDVGTGYFDVELQYKVQSAATVTGGSLITYIAGNLVPFPNSFNVTAINRFDLTNVSKFNVTLDSGTIFINNSLGIVEVSSSNILENLNIKSKDYLDLFVSDHNISNDVQVQMYKSVINVSFNESLTGNKLSNWVLYNGTTILINTTGWSGVFYPNPAIFSNMIIKSNAAAFSDRNIANITILALDNRTINYEMLMNELRINATSKITGNRIKTYSIIAVNLNRTQIITDSTTTENATFGVVNGDYYNVTINAANYSAFQSSVIKKIVGDTYLTFDLYTTNSVNITIRNELDNSLITENVTLDFISSLYSYIFTTTTGKLYEDLLNPSSYTIRYSALQNVSNPFPERFYYFSLTNRSYNDLTLYLSNGSYSNITITVYNQDNQLLEDAQVRYLKYFAATNTYNLMGMGLTNVNGVTILQMQKNTEYYKFQVYYNNILRLTTSPAYIINDDITLQVNLIDNIGTTFFLVNGISGIVTFNNNTNNYKFDFSNNEGLSYNYCLELYDVNSITGNTLTNKSCITSSSGTILINKLPINDSTVYARGTVTISGITYTLDELYKSFISEIAGKNLWLFFIMILTVIFALMSIYSLRLTFILTPLPLLLGSLAGIIPITFSICVGFELIGIILAVVVDNG